MSSLTGFRLGARSRSSAVVSKRGRMPRPLREVDEASCLVFFDCVRASLSPSASARHFPVTVSSRIRPGSHPAPPLSELGRVYSIT